MSVNIIRMNDNTGSLGSVHIGFVNSIVQILPYLIGRMELYTAIFSIKMTDTTVTI